VELVGLLFMDFILRLGCVPQIGRANIWEVAKSTSVTRRVEPEG
jgi:hypothetical protein